MKSQQIVGITRRSFLGRASGAMLVAGLASVPGTLLAADGTPVAGGILKSNWNYYPPNFDPIANSSSPIIAACAPCYNTLVQYDPSDPDKVIGDLAESWEILDGGNTIVFKIVQNAKFHDGVPLTSADVKFTFDVVRDPPAGHTSARKESFSAIKSIETPDDYTVRFNLHQPAPSLLASLAVGWNVVLPKHILEKGPMRDEIVGSGPFKVKSLSRDISVMLERNPEYHKPELPYLDEIHFYVVPDLGTVMSYFRSGQLNVFDYMSADLAPQAKEQLGDDIEIQTALNTDAFALFMNTERDPWTDISVRKAVALCIDREAAVSVLWRGEGIATGLTMPGPWELDKAKLHDIPGYAPGRTEADLEEARNLLAEAGYPDGLDARILVRKGARQEPVAIYLQDQLAQIGIRATLDIQDGAKQRASLTDHEFDIAIGSVNVTVNDPDATFGASFLCGAQSNYAQYCDPITDELFAQQTVELDPERRKSIVQELEVRVLSSYSVYILGYANRFRGVSKTVHDYFLHGNQDNNKKNEVVWIDS